MKKIFLSLFIFLFLSTFSVPVLAAGTCTSCPPDDGDNIRLQVAIPGVTKSCNYESGGETKPCYYIESNLPLYVKNIYSVSIGIIAIIAVVMIMIGGLQWIMAAGDSGKITTAKKQITGAVSGLVLILCSYVILNTINPDLVKLKLQDLNPIEEIESGTTWCSSFKGKKYEGNPYIFHQKQSQKIESGDLVCGLAYEYGYSKDGKYIQLGDCFGDYCPGSGEECFTQLGYTFCDKPEDLCNDYNKNKCEDVNLMLKKENANGKSCTMRKDKFIVDEINPDECTWEQRIFCPDESNRVSCLEGSKEYDGTYGCWKYEGEGEKKTKVPIQIKSKFCSNSNYANTNNLICCQFVVKNGTTTTSYLRAVGTETSPERDRAATEDCSTIKECDCCSGDTEYVSPEGRDADPCGVCGN